MGVVSLKMARRRALEIREEFQMLEDKIEVEELAKKMGVKVVREKLEDPEISAILIFKSSKKAQVILNLANSSSESRHRFSIAHELGHYLLHKAEGAIVEKNVPFAFRNRKSTTGQDLNEIEANQFAAELLMPEENVRRVVDGQKPTERNLEAWARTFGVSFTAMAIRLEALEII